MAIDNIFRKFTLCIAFFLISSLLTPYAVPIYYGVDSKEALSYVWIWGLCFGKDEFFFLTHPFLLNLTLIIPLLISSIVIVIKTFGLNRKKISFGKFGEQLFFCSFLIFPITFILSALIEYNFLFFPDIPLAWGMERADFWFYHAPSFGYYGLYGFSYLLLIVSVISMWHDRSKFFPFALTFIVIISIFMVYLSIFGSFFF